MIRTSHKWISTGLCAVVFLTFSLTPVSARGDSEGKEADKPIRLYATAFTGPIGRIEAGNLDNGALTINGHQALGDSLVWSGDLVRCSATSQASVSLDSMGQITLSRGTAVRIVAKRVTRDDGAKGFTLIASLVQGEIGVRLEHTASAYVRAAGTAYASSEGATFLASIREGRPSIDVKSGEVRSESQTRQHQYTIQPVGHGSNIKVEAGGLRRLQVQVLEDDKPVPGVGVTFALDTSGAIIGLLGMGTLSGTTANVVTGADGIAAVQFVARNMSGSSPISATIEGSRVSWTGQITVTSKGVSRGTGWAIFALVAAGAAGGIAYALTREKDQLEAQPPVVKQP